MVMKQHYSKEHLLSEDVHCFHSAGIHDYLKFLKVGYGKITDHACREIRLRRMTREEGIDLVSNLKK